MTEVVADPAGLAPGPLDGLSMEQLADMEASAGSWSRRRVEAPAAGPLAATAGSVLGLSVRSAPESVRDYLAGRVAELPDEVAAEADRLAREADAAAFAAAEHARQANRHASFLRNRNPRYADASYAMLRPGQDPDGQVSRFLDSPSSPSTVVFAGRARTGKTTALYAIANDAHSRGMWVEVWTAKKIADGLREDKQALWQRVTGCDLLGLDDLGRERVTDWWRDFLQELVDDRFARGATGGRMVVSVNTPADPVAAYDELIVRYGDPIVERMLDHGGLVPFDGEPIRNFVTKW